MRSGHKIVKWFSAARQLCTGIVHFFATCRMARNSSLRAASSLGNERRVLMIFRRLPLARELVQLPVALQSRARLVDAPQIGGHVFPLFPTDVIQRGAHQVHDA